MSDTIWLALIVAVPAMASPLLMAWLQNRHAAAKEDRDHERQDAVAERAEEVARLLLERQEAVKAAAEKTARLLKENNRAVAETAAETHSQLKVIHTLVNSSMTAAIQAEHDATVRELAMMREVIALNNAAGREPSREALAAVDATEQKIDELKLSLSDRTKQAKLAVSQVLKGHDEPAPPDGS
jgi:hypothetical protein